MLTANKIKVLNIFIHSRLSGKYAVDTDDTQYTEDNLIVNNDSFNNVKKQLETVLQELTSNNLTIDYLNKTPPSLIRDSMVYYYEIALKTLKRYIDDGELLIETFLALCIISYLSDEKEIIQVPYSPTELIDIFESQNYDKKILFKMHNAAVEIVDAISKADYMKYLKSLKPKSKSRKKRK